MTATEVKITGLGALARDYFRHGVYHALLDCIAEHGLQPPNPFALATPLLWTSRIPLLQFVGRYDSDPKERKEALKLVRLALRCKKHPDTAQDSRRLSRLFFQYKGV